MSAFEPEEPAELPEEPASPPEDPEDPEDDGELAALVDAVELVLGVVEVVVVVVAEARLAAPPGTVSVGAPEVLVAADPPPQAARAIETTRPATSSRKLATAPRSSIAERAHPPSAVWTIVEVLLRELIAPVAEAEVLYRPGQLRHRRRQGQQLSDDLEWLTRVTVYVLDTRLGLDHHLSAAGGGPHAVSLTDSHRAASYQRVPTRRPCPGAPRHPSLG